jgi:serine/threonine protein kinase
MNCASCGAPLSPKQTLCDACHGLALPEPRVAPGIAGFKVAQELGAGRFSQTWLVRDDSGTPLVLKLLRRYAPDSTAVQRFNDEQHRIGQLPGHPSLARPLVGGVHLVSAFFLVYQYGGETTLADELRQRGRLSPARALELCAQLCEALAILHLEGLKHLDLKPANVGLVRGKDGGERAVLLDAYTGHLLSHVGLLEEERLPLSTAAYRAPDDEPTARSDLYSIGALLFHLVSGRLPVLGTTTDELLKAHREHPPLKLADAGRAAKPELEEMLAALLAKDPAKRPANALQVALALRTLVPLTKSETDTSPELPKVKAKPPARKTIGKRWQATGVAAAVAVIAVVLLLRGAKPRPAPVLAEATPGPVVTQPQQIASGEPAIIPLTKAPAPAADPQPEGRPPPSRYSKSFERAQKALWVNKPGSAMAILRPLLMLPLTRNDRARAEHMMGEANAKLGKKAAAARWYSHSLQLSQR